MNILVRVLFFIGGIVVAVDSCGDRNEFASVAPPVIAYAVGR